MCRPCQIRECPVHLSLRVCTTPLPNTMRAAWDLSCTSRDIAHTTSSRTRCRSSSTWNTAGRADARRIPVTAPAFSFRCPTHFCAHAVSYTHLRAHETPEHLVCRL